jgi:hypothetical protein
MLKTLYRAAFALCASISATACHHVSPAEERIIGTWEFTGIDATGRVVFHRDHTVVDLFPEPQAPYAWEPAASGTWRLEGDVVVTDDQMLPIPGYSPHPRRITRIPIREYHGDRWVRDEGRGDFIRVTWDVERYSQVLALLYLISSLIALSSSIYAIRRSSFRREFALLAVAAFLALAYAALLLVAQLTETGDVVINVASLRSLRMLREVLKVMCVIIFTTGFMRLVYSVRAGEASTKRI